MPNIVKKYDEDIVFGTTVDLGEGNGIVLSCSAKYMVKEEEITDGEGALVSVVQYDERVEVDVEILMDKAATTPEVGDEVNIGAVPAVILTEVSENWASGSAKKLSMRGVKSLK